MNFRPLNVMMMNYGLEIGGQEIHVVDLSNYLAAQGHRVQVWTKGGPYERALAGCVHRQTPFDLLAPWPRRKLLKPKFIRALRHFRSEVLKTIEKESIDIVHCHGVTETTLMRTVLEPRHVPLLYSSHGWAEHLWRWHMRRLRRCDHYIGVSKFTCRKLTEYGVPLNQISHIPYGIPPKPKPDEGVLKKIRQELMSDKAGGCLVVTVARLHRQKGHDVLLRAMPRVLERYPRTVFVFVGEGPERESLEKLAEELGVSGSVRFVGAQHDVSPYLRVADIFCLPSRYEALPLSIPEAYQAGLPVIACDVAGCSEIVEDGETGFLVPSESAEPLATALMKLLGDEALRRKMRVMATEYGHSPRFDPEIVHRRIEELYQQLVGHSPALPKRTAGEVMLAKLMGTP